MQPHWITRCMNSVPEPLTQHKICLWSLKRGLMEVKLAVHACFWWAEPTSYTKTRCSWTSEKPFHKLAFRTLGLRDHRAWWLVFVERLTSENGGDGRLVFSVAKQEIWSWKWKTLPVLFEIVLYSIIVLMVAIILHTSCMCCQLIRLD